MKILALIFAAMIVSAPQAFGQSTVTGDWATEGNRSIVRIAACGDALCGTILSVQPRPDGTQWLDIHNPDKTLRSRRMEGVQILSGLRARGKGWSGGQIYNPSDGKTYSARLAMKEAGVLSVSGCVLMFCREQVWTAVK
jgi:uncharacterized protein (DUF2147 family)